MEELEKNLQQAEQKQFTKQERHQLMKQRKQQERRREKRRRSIRKLVKIAVVSGGVFALVWFLFTRSKLPPTTDVNHSEQSPPAHILGRPIPDAIQRHMLEHADGGGKPGVIIQYNCTNFECEPNLIEKLTELVRRYPNNVYLAPNNYDGKIILTKLDKRRILDYFDAQKIKSFILKR